MDTKSKSKSTIIIISLIIIITIIIFFIVKPFKKKGGNSVLRGDSSVQSDSSHLGEERTVEPNLDMWEEKEGDELPSDNDYYSGDRSKEVFSDKATFFYSDGNIKGNTMVGVNTIPDKAKGCYIIKDYTNDYDIYKLEENAPVLSHFYEQQIDDQLKRDSGILPSGTIEERNYTFTDSEKDNEARQNPLLCYDTTLDENGNPKCSGIEWDQILEGNARTAAAVVTSHGGNSDGNPQGSTFDLKYVGEDIYRSKEDIRDGKGVCKKRKGTTSTYEGTLCKNVIGKILENMMSKQQEQVKDNGPTCLFDQKTIQRFEKQTLSSPDLNAPENLPKHIQTNNEDESSNNHKKHFFGTFRANDTLLYMPESYKTSIDNGGSDDKNTKGRILQLYGKEENLYKPFTYETEVNTDKNIDNEINTLIYSKTGKQKFNPSIDFIKKLTDYTFGKHLTDVGYEITNSKNPEDTTTDNDGAGHLTAFNPRPEVPNSNFKIGDLSGESFAFVNKSFGNLTGDAEKIVETVNWRKVPTYMGRPIIHDNKPVSSGRPGSHTPNQNFIAGTGEDITPLEFPDSNDNFTYKKQDADEKQSINPLQFFGNNNDTPIYCEIDVDFKNSNIGNVSDNYKNKPTAIKDYCYNGSYATVMKTTATDKPDSIDKIIFGGVESQQNKVYPVEGIEFCHIGSNTAKKFDMLSGSCLPVDSKLVPEGLNDNYKSIEDEQWRFNPDLKKYWDTDCARYMERYPWTGYVRAGEADVKGYARDNAGLIPLEAKKIREYKIITKNDINSNTPSFGVGSNIPINITEVSWGQPKPFKFTIQPPRPHGIDKIVTILGENTYINFKQWTRNDRNEKIEEAMNSKEVEINWMKQLYYSIRNESNISKKDENTNRSELLKYPETHKHANRIFINNDENAPKIVKDYNKKYPNGPHQDNDEYLLDIGEIGINDIIEQEIINDQQITKSIPIDFKILENKLIKYLFPIGSKVSVIKDNLKSDPPQNDTSFPLNPRFYTLGIINDNKGDTTGNLNIKISNIKSKNRGLEAITRDTLDVDLSKNTELFIIKGIFTFPEPVKKSICDTFKLNYSRSNESHDDRHIDTKFGTSDLYEYHTADIGSEDLMKDLYFTMSHYDNKACFAVGEILNQGRYGADEESIKKKIKPRLENEVKRKGFTTEVNLKKYDGLYNLERTGNNISGSTWGSSICGITNHDTTYFPDSYENFQGRSIFKNNQQVYSQYKRHYTCDKNNCSVRYEVKETRDPGVASALGLQKHNTEIVSKSMYLTKGFNTTMPFKEGLMFKHDANDIKHRFKTKFIGKNNSHSIKKLLKYNHEIKNKYWGNITQKQRKRDVGIKKKKTKISIWIFIIPGILILCLILFLFLRKR
jgi:hypothetical protein